ncbi:helix-turn-helix domain-containing protein [Steroidobacter sp.]|uniref:helix-turn-helix domain-containing protein n=1 Tax=Steroidobacter sp. TaxID=1978227 RepID=UPI001A56B410|nr:helix-turn-helix transcriptional regulator [Steroidobacter sp.]MBL8265934.1 helix-turn-helix transcriptional regulator [Steroidobacter sp.]
MNSDVVPHFSIALQYALRLKPGDRARLLETLRQDQAIVLAHSLGLTKREAQIFALLSQGLRNSEIANRLFVSTRTVDHHVSAVLGKLGVPTRAAAIALAATSTTPDRSRTGT